jgi:hypothetical protein
MTLKGPFGTGQDDALSTGHGSGRVMVASGCASVCAAPERHLVTNFCWPAYAAATDPRRPGNAHTRNPGHAPPTGGSSLIPSAGMWSSSAGSQGLALTAARQMNAGQPGWG